MPPLLTIPSISASPVENRGKEKAKAEGKEKETAGNRTRKRGDDDEAYRDNLDLTVENLVQQAMRLKQC